MLVLNMEWSSKNYYIEADAHVFSNMRVMYRGTRKRSGEDDVAVTKYQISVFEPYELQEEDKGKNIPENCEQRIKDGKTISFS